NLFRVFAVPKVGREHGPAERGFRGDRTALGAGPGRQTEGGGSAAGTTSVVLGPARGTAARPTHAGARRSVRRGARGTDRSGAPAGRLPGTTAAAVSALAAANRSRSAVDASPPTRGGGPANHRAPGAAAQPLALAAGPAAIVR